MIYKGCTIFSTVINNIEITTDMLSLKLIYKRIANFLIGFLQQILSGTIVPISPRK